MPDARVAVAVLFMLKSWRSMRVMHMYRACSHVRRFLLFLIHEKKHLVHTPGKAQQVSKQVSQQKRLFPCFLWSG